MTVFDGLVPLTTRIAPGDNNIRSNGTDTDGDWRFKHTVLQSGTIRTAVFGNWAMASGGSEAIDFSTLTLHYALEVAGTVYEWQFGASTPVSITANTTVRLDRTHAISVTAGDTIYSKIHVTVASGAWPQGLIGDLTGDGNKRGNAAAAPDTVLTAGQPATQAASKSCLAPIAILGSPTGTALPIVGIVGSSSEYGSGDGGGSLSFGYVRRAWEGTVPLVPMAIAGATIAQWNAGTDVTRRLELVPSCTAFFAPIGANDISGGASLATVQSRAIALWTTLAAYGPVVTRTTNPNTGLTGGQATVRANYHDWLRGGAPMSGGSAVAVGTPGALVAGDAGHPLRAAFDASPTLESGSNSNAWVSGLNSDTQHMNVAGHTALAAAMNSWSGAVELFEPAPSASVAFRAAALA